MLRVILTVLITFLVSSCTNGAQPHDIQITDSYGEAYELTNISMQLKKQYALEKNPITLVLLTNKLDGSRFVKQLSVLNAVNAEIYQYIYVVGCTTDRDESGYSISREDATDILSTNEFQIRIYDGYGKLAYSSEKVLSEQELKSHLTKSSSER
jgi:hypothetical protein